VSYKQRFNRKYILGGFYMKKRILSLVLILIMCLSICTAALAATRQAGGSCYMSNIGRSVSFSGYSESAQAEDTIGITVILWEQRGTTWYEVARASSQLRNTDYADASGTKTVEGGHYYKVTGTHTSSKNGISYSVTSETSSRWIP
jgi:hypothetical protein